MPQFTRDIEVRDGHGTLNVHYMHKRSEVDGAVPLLFVHGSLSLPGFGFSEAPKKSGFTPDYHAEVGHKLMLSLGYNEYGRFDFNIHFSEFHARQGLIAMKYGGTHTKARHTNMSIIYYEAQHSKDSGFISLTGGNPKIPMGVLRFPKDMVVAPMSWIKTTGNVVFAGDHTLVGTNKGGGHFAAYERPEALVEDLRNMFGRGGPAFGVTSKKGGYFEK
ncbi:alpha/beta-hydrolase [Dendrothele bispora CBS 962.96]|uniref:Alpha/beta-hydrolase n=1 Tax=Dendrothele bispora (strain CBS 962.96) TaxID=1314807 RepID=A0A4S8MHX9_DENBC|nr:alpha/beta-hydrolase [Dendrothele bispora CBS 962.96]